MKPETFTAAPSQPERIVKFAVRHRWSGQDGFIENSRCLTRNLSEAMLFDTSAAAIAAIVDFAVHFPNRVMQAGERFDIARIEVTPLRVVKETRSIIY